MIEDRFIYEDPELSRVEEKVDVHVCSCDIPGCKLVEYEIKTRTKEVLEFPGGDTEENRVTVTEYRSTLCGLIYEV